MSFRVTITDEASGVLVGDYKGIPAKLAFGLVTMINQALSALRTTAEVKQQFTQWRNILAFLGIDQSPRKERRK